MKKFAIACISASLLGLFSIAVWSASPSKPTSKGFSFAYKSLTDKPGYKSGIYTAGDGLITTRISKSLSQNSLSFPSLSYSITGSQAPVVDFSLSAGSTQTLADALGSVTVSNLQMICIWSDGLDVVVSCGTTSAFGTSAGTLSVLQGEPFEWDTSMGTNAAQMPFTNWSSFSVTAGTSGTTSGDTAASTNIHIRSSLNQ
jgi:hypothetical protein